MTVDIQEIELNEEQKRRIAEIAERTGRPWRDILDERFDALSDADASDRPEKVEDLYIRDRQKRLAYLDEFLARLTPHNPNFDDSRESIYFGDA